MWSASTPRLLKLIYTELVLLLFRRRGLYTTTVFRTNTTTTTSVAETIGRERDVCSLARARREDSPGE